MGIENRDYIRENRPVYSFGPRRSGLWAIKYLLIANIAVFLLDHSGLPVNEWLSLTLNHRIGSTTTEFYRAVPKDGSPLPAGTRPTGKIEANTVVYVGGQTDSYWGIRWGNRQQFSGWVAIDSVRFDYFAGYQFWRFVTYGFCHSHTSLMHILFNMYFLWMFGSMVEPIYGSREFLLFYLSAIVVSGLCFVGVHAAQQSPAAVVGASGGVMAVVLLTAMNFPRMRMLFMLFIPVELRWMAVLYVVVDLFGFIHGGSNVAHTAHLGGAAFGVAYKYYNWRLSGLWDVVRFRVRRGIKRSKSTVKIYRPPPSSKADLDRQVDQILEKIHQQGEESLTDRERQILTDASHRYRGR